MMKKEIRRRRKEGRTERRDGRREGREEITKMGGVKGEKGGRKERDGGICRKE